jgi:hydroxypyruvate isomerase
MILFSANLGFLWKDLELPDAIRAAYWHGFDAVECHWPYDTPSSEVLVALEDTGLPMLGLNTPLAKGDAENFGLAAIPGREKEAREGVLTALGYAAEISARGIHVMAGKVEKTPEAEACFLSLLGFAADAAAKQDLEIWIEPINSMDVPGYYLNHTDAALRLIKAIDAPHLGLMFDCYHIAKQGGDVLRELDQCWPFIRHIQIAGVPDRGEPHHSTVCYETLCHDLLRRGYQGYLGAEYRPRKSVEQGLCWLSDLRQTLSEV